MTTATSRKRATAAGAATTTTAVAEISVTDVRRVWTRATKLVIVDVRDPHEWQIAALENTLFIPKGQIELAKNDVLAGHKVPQNTI